MVTETRTAKKTLLKTAVEAARATTGLAIRFKAQPPGLAERHDALVEIEDGPRQFLFTAEVKAADRVAALGHVRTRLKNAPHPGLLVTRHVTTELAEHCRRLELNFLDTAGNVYLHADGLLILVTGRRPEALDRKTTFRAFNPAGLKLIFTLLCRPELLDAPYREIQKQARVALGTINWLFDDLAGRGYVVNVGGRRRLTNARKLAEQWVENYPLKLRPNLNPRRFLAADPDWWQDLDLTGLDMQWGGEIAADRLTGNLRPEHFTIYARGAIDQLLLRKRLRADTQGNVEILERFWTFDDTAVPPDVVPPLLVYADLMATMDPRNHEVAQLLHERQIAPGLDQA